MENGGTDGLYRTSGAGFKSRGVPFIGEGIQVVEIEVGEKEIEEIERCVRESIDSVNGRSLKLLVYGLSKRLVKHGFTEIKIVYEGDPNENVWDLVLRLVIAERIAVDLWIEVRGDKAVVMDYDVFPYTFEETAKRDRIILNSLKLLER